MSDAVRTLLIIVLLGGCNPQGRRSIESNPKPTERTSAAKERPLAYVNSQPVTVGQLRNPLLEAGGGQILGELVLDRMLRRRLEQSALEVTEQLIEQEKQNLARMLEAEDPNEAQRLINELRRSRGLGQNRFDGLLWRTAAQRLLVKDEVQVVEAALQEAFQIRHGSRKEVRLIVVDNLEKAVQLVRRARNGESFVALATDHSTDLSRAQGGLLDPISHADSTWPAGMRKAITPLKAGQVSDVVVLERGFAVLKVVREIPAEQVQFDDVKEDLVFIVRANVQNQRMRELRRALLEQAKVVVTDPALEQSWKDWRAQRGQ